MPCEECGGSGFVRDEDIEEWTECRCDHLDCEDAIVAREEDENDRREEEEYRAERKLDGYEDDFNERGE